MKKLTVNYFLLLILIFCFANFAKAQKYHPMFEKTEWTFLCANFGGISPLNYKTDSIKNVFLDGKYYTKIVELSNYYTVGYCREDTLSKKVWVKYSPQDLESVLYDFNLKVGDTLNLFYNASSVNKIIVTKIDSIFTELGWLKRQKYNENTTIIEGIGSIRTYSPLLIRIPTLDPECSLSYCYNNNTCVYNINGCSPTPPCSLTVKVLSPDFCDDCGGKAMANMSGVGVTYTWSPTNIAQTANIKTGLCTGTYTVAAYDPSNGCTQYGFVTIVPKPYVTTKHKDASCFDCSDGEASVQAFGHKPLSYAWNTIPVQINDTIKGLSRGTYIVCVTDSFACQTCDTVIINSPLGFSEYYLADTYFSFYPNPGHGELIVELEGNIQGKKMQLCVYDNLGKELLRQTIHQKKETLTISQLAKGIYHAKLIAENNVTLAVKKFVVQ